ncbi:MAG: lipid II flippase MurJ [Candidatus Pacebacteria bacterium]|jgi:putative peptidoglycan lipid II flippase|nr:lipid II flippase MurJ [Candidatus Paceibacterota bacterium]|tara:strand:+ start:71357 stop:73036 length:1680 start_codon:yes stop_codon:yes gene_type:complete
MVKRIFNLIHKEIHGLHEAAYLLGIFALASQVLALIRDRLLAHFFGAGAVLDTYYAAFRIPDIIFVAIASTVSVYVLIPFLAEKSSVSKQAEKEFVSTIFSAFFIIMIAVSVLVFIFTPQLVKMFFPGLVESAYLSDLILLTRVLLLQPIFLGISNLFASITQVHRKFILYALSPILYNIGIVIGIIFLYPQFGLIGLGMGVVLGAIFHVGIQLPFIIKSGFLPKPTIFIRLGEVKKVIFLSLPRTLALSAHQISLLFLVSFASVMAVGSIAVFNFSFNLQSVPLTIIGVSYSVAAFPTLARMFSNGERTDFLEQVLAAAKHIIFWSFPAIVLFIMLRAQIVRVILGSGEFDWADTRLTAAALALFAVSLAAQGLILLFVRGYYAAGNTKKPLVLNLISAALVVLFSFILIKVFAGNITVRYFLESLLRVENIEGTSVLMLPLGYSMAVLLNAAAFWIMFQKDFKSFSRSLSRTLFQSFSAAIIMGYVVHQFLDIFDEVFNINTFLGILSQGLFAGIIGIATGVALLVLLQNKEIVEVWKSLHSKFWQADAVAPEQEEL